eukprot:g3889.t1
MHFHSIAALFVGIGIGLFGIGRALKAVPHKYDFFPNSHVMPDEYKYYDGEFTKSMYDTAITYDSEHIRKVVHIGTSNGVAVLYLGIGLQLSGHGSLVSSFDYHAANENPYISRTISLMSNIETHRQQSSIVKRNIVVRRLLHADVLFSPCNQILSKRTFGVDTVFLYQFINKDKYVIVSAKCFDAYGSSDAKVLEKLGFQLEAKSIGLPGHKLHIYKRVVVKGADIMNEAIGTFTSPINGAIIESKAEVETQAFTIGMNKNVFVGLSEDLFVNFTIDGYSVTDRFDVEEQARHQKHWTVKGFSYGTHVGEFQLIYGNEKLNVPIGQAITILFDRVPDVPLPGLQSEFKSYRFGKLLDSSWKTFRSRERIAVLMVGCSTKASEINLFLQQCKHLNNRIFDFTYLSTCRFREEKKDVEYFNDLNETCGGKFFSYDYIEHQQAAQPPVNLEVLSKIHSLSQLKKKQYEALSPILKILEKKDVFIIQSLNDHRYYHLPYLARLSQIPYRAGLLHDIMFPPKRPFGFQAFIAASSMQCRHPDYRRRTRLPCFVVNPGISMEELYAKADEVGSTDTACFDGECKTDVYTIAFAQDTFESSPGLFLHVCSRLIAEWGTREYDINCLFFTAEGNYHRGYHEILNVYKKFAFTDLGIPSDKIMFLPRRSMVEKLKNEIDIMLYLQMQSSFSTEILQAMALNVSTISFGVGGTVTYLHPNVTSKILTSTTVDHIVTEIIDALTSSDALKEKKRNAFSIINRSFNMPKVIMDLEDLYLNQFLQSSSESRISRFCVHADASARTASTFCLQQTAKMKDEFTKRKIHLRDGEEHVW